MIGANYVLRFYQSHVGKEEYIGTVVGDTLQWEITLPGVNTFLSTPMDYKGVGKQIWMEYSVPFVATSTSIRATWYPKLVSFQKSSTYAYMAIDDIRLYLVSSNSKPLCPPDSEICSCSTRPRPRPTPE